MLLLNYVADPIIHTVHGDDVLQYAALSGEIDIVEHLIIHITCKSPASRQADAYALLAAYFADRELAINYFIKSISIGVQFPVNAPKPVYGNALEIADKETLATIVNNVDAIDTQGMIKRERILGLPSPHIFSGMRR